MEGTINKRNLSLAPRRKRKLLQRELILTVNNILDKTTTYDLMEKIPFSIILLPTLYLSMFYYTLDVNVGLLSYVDVSVIAPLSTNGNF